MTTVAQDDALVSVPAWIAATAVGPVLIQHDGQLVAALVSMEDFESVRKEYADRALAALEEIGWDLREGAARVGMSNDDLEKMLDRHAL